MTTSISNMLTMGNMVDDFGILPIPMYTANQVAYYNAVSEAVVWPMMIPKSVGAAHVSRVASIAEILCYHSRFGVDMPLYSIFFENAISSKVCRTVNDLQMLMLVCAFKTFDLDKTLDVTGLYTDVLRMAREKDAVSVVSSKVDASVTLGEPALDAILEKLE